MRVVCLIACLLFPVYVALLRLILADLPPYLFH